LGEPASGGGSEGSSSGRGYMEKVVMQLGRQCSRPARLGGSAAGARLTRVACSGRGR
jgi:hypothetical protein